MDFAGPLVHAPSRQLDGFRSRNSGSSGMRNSVCGFAVASALALSAPAALADEAVADSGEWKQTVFLYAMGAAIDGTSQIGRLQLPVDISMSDLFDALKFGGMAAYRVEN